MPHLLLVDDDPEAIEWLSELAKAEGFSVATADSLRAARIHMSRLQPDIMLTDLQLPDGRGIELVDVERLRSILRRVPKSGELRAEIGELRDELRKLGRFGHILGSSQPMMW